jgi:response regulator RpfG family c-di-GMP phosphodiesterase
MTSQIKTYIYPSKKEIDISLTSENNYTIGGEIYNLPVSSEYKIERATRLTKHQEDITNILLKCIDDSSDSKLGFKMVSDADRFIDTTENLSARSYATLVINKKLSLLEQTSIVKKANEFITEQRNKYHSLFLTNYRESNSIARKRISFELAFMICNYILSV